MGKKINGTFASLAMMSAVFTANAADTAYPWGNTFQVNPKAKVQSGWKDYVDHAGNEFTMVFNTAVNPEGKTVTIDPDDVQLINHPKTGQVYIVPRQRFFDSINAQLPAVPGAPEMPPPAPGKRTDVTGVAIVAKHLTDPYPRGHGINNDQIKNAMRACFPALNLPR